MLLEEFEKLTGFYPTNDLFEAIHAEYMKSDLNKLDWCEKYKNNEDGLAESIQRKAGLAALDRHMKAEHEKEELKDAISERDKQIDKLEKRISQIEGWRPYQVSKMTTSEYTTLWNYKGDDFNYEEDVIDWLSEEFGFNPDKIRIINKIPFYEKSREGYIKRTGEFEDRWPVYSATDWNYVRFNVDGNVGYQWEVVNGSLYQYAD